MIRVLKVCEYFYFAFFLLPLNKKFTTTATFKVGPTKHDGATHFSLIM